MLFNWRLAMTNYDYTQEEIEVNELVESCFSSKDLKLKFKHILLTMDLKQIKDLRKLLKYEYGLIIKSVGKI